MAKGVGPRVRLAWRDVVAHRGRYGLSALGVALAVAVVLAAVGSQASVRVGMEGARQAAVGDADVIASSLGGIDARLPASALGALRALPDVDRVVGVTAMTVRIGRAGDAVPPPDLRNDWLFTADDMPAPGATDAAVAGTSLVAGRWPADGSEVVVTERLARRLGVEVGGVARLVGAAEVTATVVGFVAEEGAAMGHAGRSALGRVELAQRVDGDRAGYRTVRLALRPGVSAFDWLRDHGLDVPGVGLQRAGDVQSGIEALNDSASAGFGALAIILVFVGCLLCFHVNQIGTAAARRQIGVLRAIGASRADVLAITAATLGLTAVVGALAGCVLGRVLAGALTPVLAGFLGVVGRPTPIPAAGYGLAVASALAVTAAALVAGRPWRTAPLEALRDADDAAARPRVALVVSAAVLAAAGGAVALGDRAPVSGVPVGFVLLAAAAWTLRNALVWWAFRPTRPGRRSGAPVRLLGARSIAHDARLVGVSLALVMATFSVVISAVVTHQALDEGIGDVVGRQAGGDVQVFAKEPLPPGAEADVRAQPGVLAVTTAGRAALQFRDRSGVVRPLPVITVDPATYFDVTSLGTLPPGPLRAAFTDGDVVALTPNMAAMLDAREGSTVTLVGPQGPVELRVVGIFSSFTSAAAAIPTATAAARFGITTRDTMLLRADTRTALTGWLSGQFPQAQVYVTQQTVDSVRFEVLSLFAAAYSSLFLAALLCTVGMGASMSASVLRREREFRLLRSIGASRHQVRRVLLFEATAMVAVGCLVALPVGYATARAMVGVFNAQLQLSMSVAVPWAAMALFPLAVLPLAVAATMLPAQRASRVALA